MTTKTLLVYFGRYEGSAAGAKRVRQLAAGLRHAGDEAAVVSYRRSSDGGPSSWHADGHGVPYRCVAIPSGSVRRLSVLKDAWRLPRAMSDLAAQCASEGGFNRLLLYGHTWLGLRHVVRWARHEKIPVAVDLNEWWDWRGRPAAAVLDQRLFRRHCLPSVSGIVGISSFWSEYARAVNKPSIIVPALSDGEFEDTAPVDSDTFNLVYVGPMFHRDLPRTMLEAVQASLDRGCKLRLTIVGREGLFPDALATAAAIRSSPSLKANVEITGWVERERLRHIYQQAHAFMLLRREDRESLACFPTRLPEFLATGRPVVTSDIGDVRTYLRHGESAWLVPAGEDPRPVADAICALASDGARAMTIGRSGARAAASFSYTAHGSRLRDFLTGLSA